MNLQDQVVAAIYKAIDEVNGQLPPSGRLQKDPETIVFGREQGLDSLGLVNLIVALEKQVEKSFGRSVPLSDPEVILEADSPFASVGSLRDYIAARLQRD